MRRQPLCDLRHIMFVLCDFQHESYKSTRHPTSVYNHFFLRTENRRACRRPFIPIPEQMMCRHRVHNRCGLLHQCGIGFCPESVEHRTRCRRAYQMQFACQHRLRRWLLPPPHKSPPVSGNRTGSDHSCRYFRLLKMGITRRIRTQQQRHADQHKRIHPALRFGFCINWLSTSNRLGFDEAHQALPAHYAAPSHCFLTPPIGSEIPVCQIPTASCIHMHTSPLSICVSLTVRHA